MDLKGWIDKYEKKTGDKFKADQRYGFFFLPDKGFCEIAVINNMVVVQSLCGDIRFWRDKVEELARKLHIKMCGTWCIRREIKAYIRLLGYKIVEETVLSDGRSRYVGENKDGGKGWVSPAYENLTYGYDAYFVTWEVV